MSLKSADTRIDVAQGRSPDASGSGIATNRLFVFCKEMAGTVMEKPLIKFFLIAAFVVSLVYLFFYAYVAMKDPAGVHVAAKPPVSPSLIEYPTLRVGATPDEFDFYLKRAQAVQEANARAIEKYGANVGAYEKAVAAEISAGRAKSGDSSGRLAAFDKVIKETIVVLILKPLIVALLIYSGISAGGQVGQKLMKGDKFRDP